MDDLTTLKYFWNCKGDVTKWMEWDDKKESLRKSYPDIIDAIEQHIMLDALITNLINRID